jgi:thiol-disulfide isomerase/thioredoxin
MNRSGRRGPRVLGLVAVGMTAVLCGCGLQTETAGCGTGAGQIAPALRGETLQGGRFDLAAQHGHPVVVAFWASWCGPCRVEQPHLNALAQRYRGRAVFVGVDIRDDRAAADGYLRDQAVSYPSLFDPESQQAAGYNVSAPPTTVVIDASGRVVQCVLGNPGDTQLTAILDRLLGG